MYIVYDTATGLIDSIRISQTNADTRAAEEVNLSAHTGSVTVPRWVVPEQHYFKPATSTFSRESLPTLEITRIVLRTVHTQYYQSIYPRVLEAALGYPDELRAKTMNLLLGQVKAVYIKANDSDLSHALRRAYAATAIFGPSEITGHGTPEGMKTLFSTIAGITLPDDYTPGDPVSFIVLNDDSDGYDRRTAQTSITAYATDFPSPPSFDSINLTDPSWIEAITS